MAELPPRERRTALLVQVPVAKPVDDFRRVHLSAAVRGLPAHVTFPFPFAPAAAIDAELREQVAAHFAGHEPFAAELTRVGRFDAHVWLAPEPNERFVALLRDTYHRFPDFPPYGDAHGEAIPHLTIAEAEANGNSDRLAALAEQELGPGLPFGFAVDCVELFAELADGTWEQSDSFELG